MCVAVAYFPLININSEIILDITEYLSHTDIKEALELLKKQDWVIEPVISKFMLGEITDVVDHTIKIDSVIFHIPKLVKESAYILWKCFWPDCNNCCDRQGRLPLTSSDLITIGSGLKYKNTADFIKKETLMATWKEQSPSGQDITITGINLKRKENETLQEDGTHISCRFLDEKGGCGIHPNRPMVCYMYPFFSWTENESGTARVHASFQFTGDCPGFYTSHEISPMDEILKEYSKIIYDYNTKYEQTLRDGFASIN